MTKKTVLLFLCAGPLIINFSVSVSAKQPVSKKRATQSVSPVSAAEASAASWLTLVDAGKYGESWDAASPTFQAAVTRDQWTSAAQSVRGLQGAMSSRKVQTAQSTTSLPNAPAGEYVVITYATAFAQSGQALETVTMICDKDGKWRSTGYFIKSAN